MTSLTSELALGIPCLCSVRLELQGGHYKYLAFSCVSGDLSSGPHIYVASTLIAEPSLLPLNFCVGLGLQACIATVSFMWLLEWNLGLNACWADIV